MPAVKAVISTGDNRSRLPRRIVACENDLPFLLHQMKVMGHQQDAVANGDSAQRNEADEAGDGERLSVSIRASTPPTNAVGMALRI